MFEVGNGIGTECVCENGKEVVVEDYPTFVTRDTVNGFVLQRYLVPFTMIREIDDT